jgi:hypothetical protein
MYESYLKLTASQLHMHLLKRKLHPSEMRQIKDDVASMKENIRVARIARTHRKAEWAHLMKPLQYELNNAKVGRAYDLDDEARVEAFDAYIAVMEKLNNVLSNHKSNLEHTPIQLARKKNDSAKGSHIPNNGEHWTDWVPERIKQPIHDAFMELPHKPKAKRKIPFLRTVTPTQHMDAKFRLYNATKKELETLERSNTFAFDEKKAAKIEQMHKALKIIESLDNNQHVPATWNTLDLGE